VDADAAATLFNNDIGTTTIPPSSSSSSQLINDLLDADDVVLGDDASMDDEDGEDEDVEVENVEDDEDADVENEDEDDDEDSQLEFEDAQQYSSTGYDRTSPLNYVYSPNGVASTTRLGTWNAYASSTNTASPTNAILTCNGRPRCPAITVGKASTGDKTISWTATSSDGKPIQRATKITYYAREKSLNNAADLFSRWGLTQARGERLPTAVNTTFSTYVNSRTVMGRFSMPSVFNMFSALDVDDSNHDDGSDLVFTESH
jgi:hypothetical protein